GREGEGDGGDHCCAGDVGGPPQSAGSAVQQERAHRQDTLEGKPRHLQPDERLNGTGDQHHIRQRMAASHQLPRGAPLQVQRRIRLLKTGGLAMRKTRFVTWAAGVLLVGIAGLSHPVSTQSPDAVSLTGTVTSQPEGTLEGVLVIAKRDGSTISTSVVTDAQGRYAFPRNRLVAGKYAITIRASGYSLAGPVTAEVADKASVQMNLTLTKVTDPSKLASHLTSVEWFQSLPGT